MSRIRQSMLFTLELIIVLVSILTVIYAICGDIFYSHIRIFGTIIEIHSIWEPLLIIFILIGTVELAKYKWGVRARRWAFETPVYYLISFLLIYIALIIPSVLFKYYSFGFRFPDDLAHTNQALFNTLHGHPLATTCFGYIFNNWNILGDHFTPILLLLLPIYYFWQDAGILLVIQTIVIAIGAIPIYFITAREYPIPTLRRGGDESAINSSRNTCLAVLLRCKRPRRKLAGYFIAKNKLKNEWIGLAISIIYLVYPLITRFIFCEFRFDYLAMVFLIFAFWCIEKHSRLLLLAFVFLALLCKENVFIATALIGLYILFLRNLKGRIYLGLAIIAVSILYGALVWGCFMPYFRKYTVTGVYAYEFSNLGGVLSSGMLSFGNIWRNGIIVLSHFFSLIRALGFVSIFSPVILLSAGSFIENLIGCIALGPNYVLSWHWHNALYIPFIFISYIYGIKKLSAVSAAFFRQRRSLEVAFWIWVVGFPLFSGFLDFNKEIIQPFIKNDIAVSYKPDYHSFSEKAKNILPNEGTLLPIFPVDANFSSRKNLHVSVNCEIDNPDYLLMSTIAGPINVEKNLFNSLLNSGNYKQYYDNGKFMIYALNSNIIHKKGLEVDFSSSDAASKLEFFPCNIIYKNSRGLGGLYLALYCDGDGGEDEFLRISERLLNRIDVSQNPYFEIIFKVSDPLVQFVEAVFGVDINNDRKTDHFVSVHYKENIKEGRFGRHRTNIHELLKELYPVAKDFHVSDVQIIPHKLWGVDRSGSRKGWYKFWIKGIRFFDLYLKSETK